HVSHQVELGHLREPHLLELGSSRRLDLEDLVRHTHSTPLLLNIDREGIVASRMEKADLFEAGTEMLHLVRQANDVQRTARALRAGLERRRYPSIGRTASCPIDCLARPL